MILHRATHRFLHRAKNRAFIGKAHLGLLRMNVNIQLAGVHLDQDHGDRIAPHRQQGVIGLDNGLGNTACLDIAPIDKKLDLAAIGAGERGQTSIALHTNRVLRSARRVVCSRLFTRHKINVTVQVTCGITVCRFPSPASHLLHPYPHHLPCVFQAIDFYQHIEHITAASGLEDQTAVVTVTETTLWVGQGITLDDVADLARFGGGFAQKFLARRHIVEEMLHANNRTHRCPRLALVGDLTPFHAHLYAKLFTFVARGQCHLADGGNAVERFAAEAKGENVFEVIGTGQFAGGMTMKSERRFVGWHAVAVVDHAQQAHAALAYLDPDLGCARIQAIFHQLFCHIGRSLYHFTSGDFGGDIRGKNVNCHPPIIP